jgi:hypothetical protein
VKDLADMAIGEVAAYVSEHLRQNGVQVVLTGGSCVSIYTDNRYQSFDLDFIEEGRWQRKQIRTILSKIGFTEKARYFTHPDTRYFIEFPAGPLAIGDEPVREVEILEFETGTLRLLSATDCVKDRLAHYYHWNDRQCLDQAALVVEAKEVDMDEVERWSRHEGMEVKFEGIKERLSAKSCN